MKTEKNEKAPQKQPIASILSDCYCNNQIYYSDLKKQPSLFTKDVTILTVKSQ